MDERPRTLKEIRDRLRIESDAIGNILDWTRRDMARRQEGWPGTYNEDWEAWKAERS